MTNSFHSPDFSILEHRGERELSSGEPCSEIAEQKTLYQAVYNRLYPKLGQLDYAFLSERTDFPQRRIRECLQFRLGRGEVRQLFGHNPGNCYLCKGIIDIELGNEPVCLSCLQRIDLLVHKTPEELLELDASTLQLNDDPEMALAEESENLDDLSEMTLLAEDSAEGMEDSALQSSNPAQDILSILSDDGDEDLSEKDIQQELADVLPSLLTGREVIRHFGFKRMKKIADTR